MLIFSVYVASIVRLLDQKDVLLHSHARRGNLVKNCAVVWFLTHDSSDRVPMSPFSLSPKASTL